MRKKSVPKSPQRRNPIEDTRIAALYIGKVDLKCERDWKMFSKRMARRYVKVVRLFPSDVVETRVDELKATIREVMMEEFSDLHAVSRSAAESSVQTTVEIAMAKTFEMFATHIVTLEVKKAALKRYNEARKIPREILKKVANQVVQEHPGRSKTFLRATTKKRLADDHKVNVSISTIRRVVPELS